MFFAFNENPYSWGGMKMQAHVDVMEALELTGGNNDTVEEMKLWLLKQKQTQQWNSPVATADAVYALLMKGVNPVSYTHLDVYKRQVFVLKFIWPRLAMRLKKNSKRQLCSFVMRPSVYTPVIVELTL